MRKGNYLIKLNHKDERLCYVVKNSHHISEKQALSLVSRNRLDGFEKQRVLKKLHYMDNAKKEVVYELTKPGRNWINRNFSHLQGNYYTSTGIQHDITLAQQIIDRPHSQWFNERDLREMLLREIEQSDNRMELLYILEKGEISIPDGGFLQEDGSLECIEIINENYTTTQLQYKQNFQAITNIPITFIKQ